MGFMSNVTILAEPKAYEMIINSIKEYNKNELEGGIEFAPDMIEKNYEDEPLYTLKWFWVKWYPDFSEVKLINKVLQILIDKHSEEVGYGFKQVIVNEDNSTEEITNMSDLDSYLYVVCHSEIDIGPTEEIEM